MDSPTLNIDHRMLQSYHNTIKEPPMQTHKSPVVNVKPRAVSLTRKYINLSEKLEIRNKNKVTL